MRIVMGPAPCATCRTRVWLLADMHWYEDRQGRLMHSYQRCRDARLAAA